MEDSLIMAPKKRAIGLGRGLNALLGEAVREEPLVQAAPGATASLSSTRMIAVTDIAPHPGQPRRYFEPEALDELAQSIASRGVIQPVIVRPAPSGKGYQLVAGERRWRAAQRAHCHEIPAIVRDLDDKDTLAIALIENIQRADLNPMEEAHAYIGLMKDGGYTPQTVAKLVDKSRSHIANLVRLVTLPEPVQQLVLEQKLTMGHARALINCDHAESLAAHILDKGLSVRETEKLARTGMNPQKLRAKAKPAKSAESHPDIAAVESHLEDLLGLKVKIVTNHDNQSGAITVQFASLDQLDLVCQRLSGDSF